MLSLALSLIIISVDVTMHIVFVTFARRCAGEQLKGALMRRERTE